MGTALWFLCTLAVAALAGLATALALRPIRLARAAERLARAQRDFRRQREQLEAKFFDRASSSGKPRGLRWADIHFDDDVIYAREEAFAGAAAEASFDRGGGGSRETPSRVKPGSPAKWRRLRERCLRGRPCRCR